MQVEMIALGRQDNLSTPALFKQRVKGLASRPRIKVVELLLQCFA